MALVNELSTENATAILTATKSIFAKPKLAVARQHLGSLDKVTRIVRLGVSVATSGDVRDQTTVGEAAESRRIRLRNSSVSL
jgi:hypothetical protein